MRLHIQRQRHEYGYTGQLMKLHILQQTAQQGNDAAAAWKCHHHATNLSPCSHAPTLALSSSPLLFSTAGCIRAMLWGYLLIIGQEGPKANVGAMSDRQELGCCSQCNGSDSLSNEKSREVNRTGSCKCTGLRGCLPFNILL